MKICFPSYSGCITDHYTVCQHEQLFFKMMDSGLGIKIEQEGTGEMDWRLRALAADRGSIPSTHMSTHNYLKLQGALTTVHIK